MKVIIAENYQDASKKAADIMEKIIREKPTCTIGLATGSSPVGMYQELSRRCKEEGLDFSKIHSVNLDEYVGLEPTHNQSYRYFMDSNLFDHINIDKANTYVAKGIGDVEENLKEFNEVLDSVSMSRVRFFSMALIKKSSTRQRSMQMPVSSLPVTKFRVMQ